MGHIGSPETSILNHFMLRYKPEDGRLSYSRILDAWRIQVGPAERESTVVMFFTWCIGSLDSSVGIATRYGLYGLGIESW
jgi:hypothetical protein